MKKVLFILGLSLLTLSCNEDDDFPQSEYDCLAALATPGNIEVIDHPIDRPELHRTRFVPIQNPSTQFNYYCYKRSDYTYNQMVELVKDQFPNFFKD